MHIKISIYEYIINAYTCISCVYETNVHMASPFLNIETADARRWQRKYHTRNSENTVEEKNGFGIIDGALKGTKNEELKNL